MLWEYAKELVNTRASKLQALNLVEDHQEYTLQLEFCKARKSIDVNNFRTRNIRETFGVFRSLGHKGP